ncbi:MAG TPA: hypothetical protein VGH74_11455 [Planctomycetaceae bacterium]|jgi:hypothetical protein
MADPLRHPEVEFEPAGVRLRQILAILAGIAGLFLLVLFATWRHFRPPSPPDEQQLESYDLPAEHLPRRPRLEPLDATSGALHSRILVNEQLLEQRLHGYGTTAEKGFVHVPIERAMTAVLEKLPVKPIPREEMVKSFGLLGGGGPGSGRIYQKPPAWWGPQP